MWPIGFYKVIGKSMEPTYFEGDYLIVNRWAYCFSKPRKGDMVLVQNGRIQILKRIARIKDDCYYLVGDNKNHSTDSRTFGWVEREKILGNVLFHIRP